MFIDLPGLQVNYEVSGEGPPLVLVHGGGLDLVTWEDMLPHLEPRHRVYRFDMRGFGKTKRLTSDPLSMRGWSNDLLGLIETLHLDRPSVAGWSLGGAVAIELAASAPGALHSISLFGAPGPSMVAPDRSGFDRREAMIREGRSPDEVIEATFDFTKAAFSSYSVEHNPRSVQRIKDGLKRNFTTNYAEMVEALRSREISPAKLGQVTCPALIVVGEHDTRTPVSMSEDLNRYINRSYMKILVNCGHYYGYEYPKECSLVLLEFLHAFG